MNKSDYKTKLMEKLKASLENDPEQTLTKLADHKDSREFEPLPPGKSAAYNRGYRQGQADTAQMILDLLKE